MYQVFEAVTGKRRYVGGSFYWADSVKERLSLNGVPSFWVFVP